MKENKTFGQIIKFALTGCIASVIQFALVNILFFVLKTWTTPLNGVFARIFSEETMGKGNSNWGYVMTFFLSNLVANIVGYFLNKKKVFKSDARAWCFYVYITVSVILILSATWLQGLIANALFASCGNFAPTLATAMTATMQAIIIFVLEKFVLLR